MDLDQLLEEDGLSRTCLYPGVERSVGLYALTVADVQSHTLRVNHDPVETNWYHGGICGEALGRHSVRKKLAKACAPVISIDEDQLKPWLPAAVTG